MAFKNLYLGPSFSAEKIEKQLPVFMVQKLARDDTAKVIAKLLAKSK